MKNDFANIPEASPQRIFTLRESSFAIDLFITAVSYFDFFNRLGESPAGIDDICHSLKIKHRPADVMLTLFKAYGFIKEKNKKFYLTDVAGNYLKGGSAYNLTSYVNSLKDRPVCLQMKKVLTNGKPANWAAAKSGKAWASSMDDPDFAESFTAGMNSRGAYLAAGLSAAIDLINYNRILDVGGSSGVYTSVLLRNNPHLRGTVFDKPPVDKVARYAVKKLNMSDRIDVFAGDMFHDSLPKGHDVHLISHVLHDWDFPEVKTVLQNSYDNLSRGGIVVLHDAHLNARKTGPLSVAEYSVLLMFLSEGKCYSVGEMKDVLEQTGFKDIEHRPTILNRSIIIGKK